MRTRLLLSTLTLATVGSLAVPSHAASTGAATLFFANEGGPGTGGCTPSYVLDKAASGNPCSNIQVGYSGNGLLAKDVFSSVKKAVGFKLSSARHLTGVVYFATYPIVNGTPVNTLPGPLAGDITILINGTEIGTVKGSGQVVAPNSDLAVPLDLPIPASLNKKVVKSVEVDIAYKTGFGVVGTEYSSTSSSKLVLPTTK